MELSGIAADDGDDLLCIRLRLGRVRLLTLRIHRQGADYQNRNDQPPVHKFPRDPQVTIRCN